MWIHAAEDCLKLLVLPFSLAVCVAVEIQKRGLTGCQLGSRTLSRMQGRAAGRWETEHWVCYYRNQGDLAGQRWTRQRRGTSRFWQELSLLAIWRYFTSKAFVVSPDLERFFSALQPVIPPGSTLLPTTPSCQCHSATQLVINARKKGGSGGVSSQRGNLS